MLLRIVNDPRPGNKTQEDGTPLKNSELIDKIIAVHGMPKSFYLRANSQWTVLRHGLESDVLENIPSDIFDKFGEPFEVDVVFPAMERGEKPWAEKQTVYGLKVDTQTNDGMAAIVDFERMVAAATPATQRPPKAEVVGDRSRWNLPVEDVPEVDLSSLRESATPKGPISHPTPIAKTQEPQPPVKEGYCEVCNKTFMNKKALAMHQRRTHDREKVGV